MGFIIRITLKHPLTIVFIFCALFCDSLCTVAQDKEHIPLDHFYVKRKPAGTFRKYLKNITFGANTGLGTTFFSHRLEGMGFYQPQSGGVQVFTQSPAERYTNWVTILSIDNSAPDSRAYISSPGANSIKFEGKALNIPLNVFLFYELKKIRLGVGYSYELMSIGSLYPKSLTNEITSMKPTNPLGFVRKYYFLLGYSFYRLNNYLFTGDLHFGNYKPQSNFDKAITGGNYFNLGITAEREMSEYLKFFIRPSFEFKSYDFPIADKPVRHSINALYLEVGITYKIPKLRRCVLRDCHAQIDHAHGNREYRSRRHSILKKQNPGYGENDKPLIKQSRKIKRKSKR